MTPARFDYARPASLGEAVALLGTRGTVVKCLAGGQSLVAIVGPNGAGKSTLIKACLGLIPMASGRVEFWGQPLRQARGRIGYVPQRESVDWEFTVSALDVACTGRYRKIGGVRPVSRDMSRWVTT